jgi:proteasome assembly chaperone (PAC2) family protein
MSALEWVKRPSLRRPAAVVAFAGWGDAGEASTGAAEHLLRVMEGEAFARLDPDPFYEFQARRPMVEITPEGTRTINWPRNEFHVAHHPQRDLVVVLGEEPHLLWRRFCEEMTAVLIEVGVEQVVTIGAFLGQVAHTLPVPLVGVASSADMLEDHGLLFSGYEGPTGIVGALTTHLIERGVPTMSVWAAVPHYLANQTYPPAIEVLVRKVIEVTGIGLDVSGLATESDQFRLTVDAAIKESKDVSDYVHRLEADAGGPATADLMNEIERYLRDR